MPAPVFFTSMHDDKMVRTFLNAYDMYLKVSGLLNGNTKAQFAKTRLKELNIHGITVKAIIRQQ